MSLEIEVDGQIFEFIDGWSVSKIDEWPLYRKHQIEGQKACDLVALQDNELLLIEVKDYSYPGTVAKDATQLAIEITQKVLGSMALIFSLSHTAAHGRGQLEEREISRLTLKNSLRVVVVASVELHLAHKKVGDGDYLKVLKNQLRKFLSPYVDRIEIDSSATPSRPESFTHRRNSERRARYQ